MTTSDTHNKAASSQSSQRRPYDRKELRGGTPLQEDMAAGEVELKPLPKTNLTRIQGPELALALPHEIAAIGSNHLLTVSIALRISRCPTNDTPTRPTVSPGRATLISNILHCCRTGQTSEIVCNYSRTATG